MGRRTFLTILALLTVSAGAQAQQVGRIVGRVMVGEGQYLAGIQVTVIGTSRGALSDTAGRFTITDVPAGQQIVRATRLGYSPASQTVTVTSGQAITVTLQLTTSIVQLEGVVTIGYGTQNRREVNGSVSTVRADVMQQVVGGNALDA